MEQRHPKQLTPFSGISFRLGALRQNDGHAANAASDCGAFALLLVIVFVVIGRDLLLSVAVGLLRSGLAGRCGAGRTAQSGLRLPATDRNILGEQRCRDCSG